MPRWPRCHILALSKVKITIHLGRDDYYAVIGLRLLMIYVIDGACITIGQAVISLAIRDWAEGIAGHGRL